MDINWDEVPEGFDYALTTAPDWDGELEYEGTIRFAKKVGNSTYFECTEGKTPVVGPYYWMIIATRPEKWNGKGLPPVGTVCEVKCTARGKERDWFKAEVKYISLFTVILDDFTIGELEGEFVVHPDTVKFRPIKTKEQLAAEEREKAVEEMFARFGGPGGLTRKQCIWVISEGYRKQEDNDAKA